MMNFKIRLNPVWMAFLLCVLPLFSSGAEELPLNTPAPVCANHLDKKVITEHSVVTFISSPTRGGARWICMDGKLILEASKRAQDENDFDTTNLDEELLEENGKLVMRQGRPVVLRMIANENAYPDLSHYSFWLLDFRSKEPLIVGPMVAPGLGRVFSVIWHEDNVIVVFDDDGGPGLGAHRYHEPNWGKEERHFVQGIEAEAKDAIYETRGGTIDMVPRPLMNKDGLFHPGKRNYINMPHDKLVKNGKVIPSPLKGKARNVYPAYHYDYKTNKLTAVAIEED